MDQKCHSCYAVEMRAKTLRLAYIISAYKNPHQVVRLVKTIYSPHDYFLIHFDKKSSNTEFKIIKEGLSKNTNVIFLKRHNCNWGDFGHVRATLKGISFLVENKLPFEYCVLLTAQDYPLKGQQYLKNFLLKSKPASFMEHQPLKQDSWEDAYSRISNVHIWFGKKIYSIPREPRPLPANIKRVWTFTLENLLRSKRIKGLDFYGGSSYWILHKKAINYIYKYKKKTPSYVSFFKRVHISDELFFQTLLMNSPLASTIVNESLRYIDWSNPNETPSIIRAGDVPQLLNSRYFFARKFDTNVDQTAIDLIDKTLQLQ